MFDSSWIADLDAASACEAVLGTQSDLREAEWRELALAAQWAVLHQSQQPQAARAGQERRGRETVRPAGGDGTPLISGFAAAELALLMGTGFITADKLIRDAVDLQQRHPRLWQALGEGKARVWKARQVARMTRVAGLTREQAWFVDAATAPYVDSLAWAPFVRLVEAKIIEADPAAAEERREAAALERFVATGRCNEHGLKTLVAKATAGDVLFFVAVCDRIAQLLELEGDTDPVGARRSKALGILANPAEALALLERHSSDEPTPADPTPDDETSAALAPPNTCSSCGGPRIGADKLRPRAVLYVRVSQTALQAGTGVAACESGVGPVTVESLRELLGHHRVTVRPVLDLRAQVPVEAYEVPEAMRESLRLARPSSVYPWAWTDTRPDMDHTRPYVKRSGVAAGEPLGSLPKQTRIGNLGPLDRLGHRVKTFGRGWRVRQPVPGIYLWRTSHGYWFRVDNDGTHPLGRDPDLADYRPIEPQSAMERRLAVLVAESPV
jgi:hypothetical protein